MRRPNSEPQPFMERYIYVYVWSWRAATKRNTTFNLDDELVQRGKAYAAAHGTTLTALVRDHLTKVTGYEPNEGANDPLVAFSKGAIDKAQAIEQAGLRD